MACPLSALQAFLYNNYRKASVLQQAGTGSGSGLDSESGSGLGVSRGSGLASGPGLVPVPGLGDFFGAEPLLRLVLQEMQTQEVGASRESNTSRHITAHREHLDTHTLSRPSISHPLPPLFLIPIL